MSHYPEQRSRVERLKLLYHTLQHLRLRQIVYQFWRRMRPVDRQRRRLSPPECRGQYLEGVPAIPRPISWHGGEFTFINRSKAFASWRDMDYGALWNYNLNYMDYLGQSTMTLEEGARWIECFMAETTAHPGWDPYPTALRMMNWIRFFSLHKARITPRQQRRWDSYLYAEYQSLAGELEYHLLGNHLLEDAYALYVTALYFGDEAGFEKSSKLLLSELSEQILSDGMHYEQSPMYHAILLERLLDCYNFSKHNERFASQGAVTAQLRGFAERMLGHLRAIAWRDGSLPLVNDSAEGIASPTEALWAYAERLGLSAEELPLGASGYRKIVGADYEILLDVGNVTASYQPGHTHADSLSFLLRLRGQDYIIDTGISTYDKNSRRQYERATAAHNTVTSFERDSSEVWGGFRVGRRAQVVLERDEPAFIEAYHAAYQGRKHRRSFRVDGALLCITDSVGFSGAVSHLHFAPEVQILAADLAHIQTSLGSIRLEGARSIELEEGYAARAYHRLEPIQRIKIHFEHQLNCTIEL